MFANYEGILKENKNWYNYTTDSSRVLAWLSGGASSFVACYMAVKKYPDVHVCFCDTGREHETVFTLLEEFTRITGKEVHVYESDMYKTPEDVWIEKGIFSKGGGAPCSHELKALVRARQVENLKGDYAQVFGYDFSKREIRRATSMIKNHAELNPKFPLLEEELTKEDVFKYMKNLGVAVPYVYNKFKNNNCLGREDSSVGGCIRGGIGYWFHMQKHYPKKFARMAELERQISKDKPITVLKKQYSGVKSTPLFLEKNDKFPKILCLADLTPRKYNLETIECRGFCGE